MTSKTETASPVERAPTYVPEVEALLGTQAFYDETLESQLYAGELTFTAETAGMRGLLYVRALRLMARAVAETQVDLKSPHRMRQLGTFALNNLPEVLEIARQLAVINTAERTLAEQEESFLGGLRNVQHPYMHDIIAFLNMARQPVEYTTLTGERRQTYLQGALVEAPTGLGKTVLMARALVAAGVGRPIENIEHDQGHVRALIIVPSQTIVEQMSGKVGDDTLRRFAPGINVGAYYQFEQDHTADAVVITIDKFVENFRNGLLFAERFDICIIDEAHTITQPQLLQVIAEHWRGGPIIGFTATPEYNPEKDARKILRHHIYHGDLLDYIKSEEDVLNAAQLFEIRAEYDAYAKEVVLFHYENDGVTEKDVEQMITREATAEYLMPQIAEGRCGILFCEQGGGEPSGYAKLMAERLRMLTKPDGTPLRVAVAGTINAGLSRNNPNNNTNIRKRYAAGELDFIVTVDWGREGLNEDIDSVTTVGKITSSHKWWQEIGRGTRLSKRFPVTVYGHVFVPSWDPKALSLFGLFGFETIEQGVVIGRKPDKSDQPDKPDNKPASPSGEGIDRSAFPLRIQGLINTIHTKIVGEALLHKEISLAVNEDYKQFETIMQDVPGPPITIRKYLRDEKGFACIGRYEQNRTFVFYFEPEAETFLDTYRGAVARVDLQREFGGVDVSIVDAMATKAKVTSIMWFYHDGKWIPHFTAESAKKIREVYNKTPAAGPTDYGRVRLAKAAGVPAHGLTQRLTTAEKAQSIPMRTTTANGMIRILDHWKEEDALAIIERIKEIQNTGIPPYLVPRELATRHIDTGRDELTLFAERSGHPAEIVRVARSGRPPRCFTWEALRLAEEQYGTTSGVAIDYSRLPADNKDKDPAKLAYAQQVLADLSELPPPKPQRKKNPQ